MKFTTTLDVPLTIEQLAGLFADLDDDSQAKFFVEAARLLGSQHVRNTQAFYIGRHLRDCACSTEEAREFLTGIVESMRPKAKASDEVTRALDHFLSGAPMSEFEG